MPLAAARTGKDRVSFHGELDPEEIDLRLHAQLHLRAPPLTAFRLE